jgi:hypothetical protein
MVQRTPQYVCNFQLMLLHRNLKKKRRAVGTRKPTAMFALLLHTTN